VRLRTHRRGARRRVNTDWNLTAGTGNLAILDLGDLLGRACNEADQCVDARACLLRRSGVERLSSRACELVEQSLHLGVKLHCRHLVCGVRRALRGSAILTKLRPHPPASR